MMPAEGIILALIAVPLGFFLAYVCFCDAWNYLQDDVYAIRELLKELWKLYQVVFKEN